MPYNIKIKKLSDIPALCKKISALDFDVDARSGRYIIDAKSIMGLYSLNLSAPIVIEPASSNITVTQAEKLKEAIKEFEV